MFMAEKRCNFDSSLWLSFFYQPLDLSNTFGDRNSFGAYIRTPPHGPAPPYAILVVQTLYPFFRCRIPRIKNISKCSQKGSRTCIVIIGPVNRACSRTWGTKYAP